MDEYGDSAIFLVLLTLDTLTPYRGGVTGAQSFTYISKDYKNAIYAIDIL